MLEIPRCPECRVPEPFSQQQMWLNNGDIVQTANPNARMGFIECENLDPLFRIIGEIIGVSIEHMVVNSSARATAAYMKRVVPQDVRDMVMAGQIDPDSLRDPIISYCHVIGYGKYEKVSARYNRDENDYAKYRIMRPFSVPLAAGALAGAVSSLVEGEHNVTYGEVFPQYYEFTTHWTEYPMELKEKIRFQPYRHREGDIELERCATCGAPKALGLYRWYLDEGLIINDNSGRRSALLGPALFENVFRSLEEELGETIPRVVVEAQRRFTKSGFYSVKEMADEGVFRTQLALRGLGNLQEIKMGPWGLSMRIGNAVGHLLTVGMVQGLFEMAFDVDSRVEWSLSEDNDLQVEIKPRG